MPTVAAHRKKFVRFESNGAARFLTFSCFRRLPLFQNDRIKGRFVERLTLTAERHSILIFAWVVMPEHVHLVVLPDRAGDVTRFLTSLKSSFATEVMKRWRSLDAPVLDHLCDAAGRSHFWQVGGGYDRLTLSELAEKIGYCHANPAARGLCHHSDVWPWSSARAYANRADYVGPAIAFDQMPRLKGPLI